MITDNLYEPPMELRNNQPNSTTFESCGWCKHASGSHRYNYCISGNCQLQKQYDNEIKWDTKCILKNASKSQIFSLVKDKKRHIESCKESISRYEEHITMLIAFQTNAKYCPTLPEDRECNHFHLEDEIRVYVDDCWYSGNVVNGYRSGDGCVSYEYFNNGLNSGGCGLSIPHILLRSEYEFFQKNKDAYENWCSIAYNKSFNGTVLTPVTIV